MTQLTLWPEPDGFEFVYVAFITLRNGKRLYARQYGRRAFRLKVRKKPSK